MIGLKNVFRDEPRRARRKRRTQRVAREQRMSQHPPGSSTSYSFCAAAASVTLASGNWINKPNTYASCSNNAI